MNKQIDILVIDDEQVIIEAVKKICSSEDFSVDSSSDANEALKKIDVNNYKIMVCDIMMPEMDGFEFLDQLHVRKNDTPVIMTTGFSTVENAVKSLYKGAIDFIPKPFTVDEILNSIFRGMKYLEIQEKIKALKEGDDTSTIIYVTCPSKYYRLGYSSWIVPESSGSVLVGVTDLFLRTIDSITKIETFKIDDEVVQGNPLAFISTKDELTHTVLSPISGRIIEQNTKLINSLSIIEKDPYFEGWFYRIIPSDFEYELKNLTACSSDRL